MPCNDSVIVHVCGSCICEQQGGRVEMLEQLANAERHVCKAFAKNESRPSYIMLSNHCDQWAQESREVIKRMPVYCMEYRYILTNALCILGCDSCPDMFNHLKSAWLLRKEINQNYNERPFAKAGYFLWYSWKSSTSHRAKISLFVWCLTSLPNFLVGFISPWETVHTQTQIRGGLSL